MEGLSSELNSSHRWWLRRLCGRRRRSRISGGRARATGIRGAEIRVQLFEIGVLERNYLAHESVEAPERSDSSAKFFLLILLQLFEARERTNGLMRLVNCILQMAADEFAVSTKTNTGQEACATQSVELLTWFRTVYGHAAPGFLWAAME
jgi:hypothetical protein